MPAAVLPPPAYIYIHTYIHIFKIHEKAFILLILKKEVNAINSRFRVEFSIRHPDLIGLKIAVKNAHERLCQVVIHGGHQLLQR